MKTECLVVVVSVLNPTDTAEKPYSQSWHSKTSKEISNKSTILEIHYIQYGATGQRQSMSEPSTHAVQQPGLHREHLCHIPPPFTSVKGAAW